MGNFGEQVFFKRQYHDSGQNDFRTVITVELLDAFAGIGGDLAERINSMRKDARKTCIP